MQELDTYEGLPVLADDTLIQIAKQAEARIDAVIKIKQMALKVTNAHDWTDQQGKPYLQASGSEKVANLFNISWAIDEPIMETEADGTITYIYKGKFSLAGRSIEVEGSRSSRDTFFKKYNYDEKGDRASEKPLDRRDLKMAAMTNLLGNGITRLLGIRNLTWDDLKTYAGITQDMVGGKVSYKKDGKDLKEPEIITKKVRAYIQEEKRKAEEEEARLREIARKLEEERILAEATELEKEGRHGEAEERVTAPINIVTPVVKADIPVYDKRIYREPTSKARVTNLFKLIQFVATRQDCQDFLLPNEKVLNQKAKSMGKAMNIPGVEYYEE